MSEEQKPVTAVDYFDFLANVFEQRDWNYTRKTNLKRIQYVSSHDRTEKLSYRVKTAFNWLFRKSPDWMEKKFSLRSRFSMFIFSLQRDTNLPDGILDGGNIITFWEETGEYLEYVQPSVGSLLANFLKEEPEHPHAKLIIAEMTRILESKPSSEEDA